MARGADVRCLSLDSPVTFVPGVGPQRAALLARLGIETVRDLLHTFPLRYEQPGTLVEAVEEPATVRARVVGPAKVVRLRGQLIVSADCVAEANGESFVASFFNQAYVARQLRVDTFVQLRGRFNPGRRTFSVSSHQIIADRSRPTELSPVYPRTAGLSNTQMVRMISAALRVTRGLLEDPMPFLLRQKYRLVARADALTAIHAPHSAEDLKQARRRLVFEEFLAFQLHVQGLRRLRHTQTRPSVPLTALREAAAAVVVALPFALTSSQQACLDEILLGLSASQPMHRLLQGDVGCGKTAVAFAAAAAVVASGGQVAVMVPTSLLAQQHLREAQALLGKTGLRMALLSAAQSAQARRELTEQLAAGHIDIVVGTHALTSSDVAFRNLRLVVIDEQQRFGVSMRRLLRAKGKCADVLQLTATPIPRTLALTLYGDVDISTIRELPPGRQPIATVVLREREESVALAAVRAELAKGRQAYIVAPSIADGQDEADGVVTLHARLEEELAPFCVGLVHGGLAETVRNEVMEDFVQGKVAVVVATSIVEVGVSVARATVIVVYGAERFGIATLHQLRGRVGRGTWPSHCYLIARGGGDLARRRLKLIATTVDGFALSEYDLQLRGPGEAFGQRQSGLPVFAAGDPIRDANIMAAARDEALRLLQDDDFWLLPQFGHLRQLAEDEITELADS
jgi:ATP-dependent DNA helicase RecG